MGLMDPLSFDGSFTGRIHKNAVLASRNSFYAGNGARGDVGD